MTEAAIRQRVESDGEGTLKRLHTVDLAGTVHSLPMANSTAHDLSSACWCEPQWTLYTPADAVGAERYRCLFHHDPS